MSDAKALPREPWLSILSVTSLIKTLGLRGGESCPNSRSWELAQPGFEPRPFGLPIAGIPPTLSTCGPSGGRGAGMTQILEGPVASEGRNHFLHPALTGRDRLLWHHPRTVSRSGQRGKDLRPSQSSRHRCVSGAPSEEWTLDSWFTF